jgi:hypothetical protein
MVHEHDRDLELALHLTQVGQERCDLGRGVLVDAVQPYEGIKDQDARLERGDRLPQTIAIAPGIQPHARCRDDVHIERSEARARRLGDAGEPAAHDIEGVFGSVQQRRPGPGHSKPAQARRARRDADRYVKREKRLTALRLTADDADRRVRRKLIDQPTLLLGAVGRRGSAPCPAAVTR